MQRPEPTLRRPPVRCCGRPTPAAFAVLVGCLLCWWSRLFFTAGTRVDFVNQDALVYWVSLLREVSRQWREGSVPLWNPYQAFGGPLLADPQAAALYPFQLPYLFLGPGPAWAATIVAHHVLLLLGTWQLCRSLQLSRSAALVGAANMGFAGLVLEAAHDQPAFITLAWLPLLCACAVRLALRPNRRTAAILAATWGMQILAGYPQTIVYSGYLVLAWLITESLAAARNSRTSALCIAKWAMAAALLASCLAAAQLLPTLELVGLSVRAPGRMTAAQQAYFAASPNNLFGAGQGVLPLGLAILGAWWWPRRRTAWFLALSGLVTLLLAVGPLTPLFELARRLPPGTWLRGIGRILPLWCLCASVLSAAGAQVLFDAAQPHMLVRPFFVSAGIATAVRIVDLAISPTAARGAAVPCEFLLPVLFMFSQRGSWEPARKYVPTVVLVAVAAIPHALFHPGVNRLSPFQVAALYESQATLFNRIPAPGRILSLVRPRLWPFASWARLGTYFRRPVLADKEPLAQRDFEVFVAALRGVPVEQKDANVFIGDILEPPRSFNATLLNLSGVAAIVVSRREAQEELRWFPNRRDLILRAQTTEAAIYENRRALPRAFFVPDRPIPAGASCVERLTAPDFDPRAQILLDSPPAENRSQRERPPAQDPATVRRLEIHPARVVIHVETGQPGFVVLTDAYYPGWVARVNGRTVPIRRANCFFRAVAVPAGASHVEFRYEPMSFRLGRSVSLAAAFLLSVMVLPWGAWRLPRLLHRCG